VYVCVCVRAREDERCPLEHSYLALSLERVRERERTREGEREREKERERGARDERCPKLSIELFFDILKSQCPVAHVQNMRSVKLTFQNFHLSCTRRVRRRMPRSKDQLRA
jgi:hypothetical protein